MPHITRDGVQIYYEDNGSGTPILLSHGYSATTNMWNGQANAFPGYRVITWDMRGHGRSDSPEDPSLYSEAHTTADMRAILQHLGIQKAIIAGLSLGGYMSLAFNVAYPEMVSALMLFDTGPGYKNDVAREGWNKTAYARAEAFEQKGLSALGAGREVLAATHRSAAGLALAARHMLTQYDDRIIRSLETIAVPTLVLVGETDEPFLAASEYMAKKIPNATRVVVQGAGHAANIDQPEGFNKAVNDYLATLS